ncbi:MAG TPA: hypothetical protein VF498_17995 [Anaerolineales bacterium]
MSASTAAYPTQGPDEFTWLRSRKWDLTWITLSVALVAAPYLTYLGILRLETFLQPVAASFGTTVDSLARNFINAFVGLVVGGPHMYATFTRTALDRDFARQHPRFLWSSLWVPVVVVTGALLNLSLLLTFFFFWASVHVLHQIVYILDLYNHRQKTGLTRFSRLSDYAVVLTALYPLAVWKIVNHSFMIGSNDLGSVIATIVPLGNWMIWLAGGVFGLALATWAVKSFQEYRQGVLNRPKTLFIALTAGASFFVPALGNLDTAFQGMNVWHSLQYLALTWMLNNLRQERGELEASPFVERLSDDGSARRYYWFNILLTLGDVVLAGVIYVVLRTLLRLPFDAAFDRAYYIAILSFLWIHYYHDHYLFSKPQVIEGPA